MSEHLALPLALILILTYSGCQNPKPPPERLPESRIEYDWRRYLTAEEMERERRNWQQQQQDHWNNRPQYSPGDPEPQEL